MIYIGRKSQVVIDYAHLLQFSRLHGAIAIQTDYRSRREIFEIRKPEECAQYLETILARFAGASFRAARDNSPASCPASNDDGEFVPAKEGWVTEEVTAGGLNETVLDDEIETDGLTRRNWRIERMRMRLRDTGDFQEQWQEPHTGGTTDTGVAVSVGRTRNVECVEGMEDMESTSDMMSNSVAEVLSEEVGERE